jgi:tRNA A-37 threonylcarbamoyl transferase component Bud32
VIGATVGSYRVDREIGHGGMGVVYVAEHPLIGRKAAVKVLKPDFSRNQEVVNRFFNEARAAARIKHPGLVDVFDFGYNADGSAYIVMEFLDGESLGARLERERKLPQTLILEIGRQTAAALAAAHQQGIIHRDLKPDNLFLVPDAELGIRVKVLDFGIAKLTIDEGAAARQTQTGVVMGTPLYMSPEQGGGAGKVDPRADIYSLGCILFDMACGRPPFIKEGMGETIAAHIYEPPPSPRSIEPSVSPGLEAVILRCLEKEPDKRPPTMLALRAELEGVGRADAKLEAHPPTLPAGTRLSEVMDIEPARKSRAPLFIAGGAVIVVAGVLALTMGGKKQPEPPPPAPVVAVEKPVEKPAPVVEKKPEKVTLKVTSEPPGADVFRAADGVLVGMTPLSMKMDPIAGKAVFLIKKSGYKDARAELDADHDGEAQVKLDKPHAPAKKPDGPKPKTRVRDGAYDPYAK